jgi:hypothetical protein
VNKNAIRLLATATVLAILTFHEGARAQPGSAEAKPGTANSRYFAVQSSTTPPGAACRWWN